MDDKNRDEDRTPCNLDHVLAVAISEAAAEVAKGLFNDYDLRKLRRLINARLMLGGE